MFLVRLHIDAARTQEEATKALDLCSTAPHPSYTVVSATSSPLPLLKVFTDLLKVFTDLLKIDKLYFYNQGHLQYMQEKIHKLI